MILQNHLGHYLSIVCFKKANLFYVWYPIRICLMYLSKYENLNFRKFLRIFVKTVLRYLNHPKNCSYNQTWVTTLWWNVIWFFNFKYQHNINSFSCWVFDIRIIIFSDSQIGKSIKLKYYSDGRVSRWSWVILNQIRAYNNIPNNLKMLIVKTPRKSIDFYVKTFRYFWK